MQATNSISACLVRTTVSVLALFAATGGAYGAVPGITGPTFNLVASAGFTSQPDGASIYTWGYGCSGAPSGFLPTTISGAFCNSFQLPGPTLIVHKGDSVTVRLRNSLPAAAGNTSMLFPGFKVTATVPVQPSVLCTSSMATGSTGLLTKEATHGCLISYTFTADTEGTHSYYSGTQGDLQVEMGLYGALIVLPSTTANSATCAAAPETVAVAAAQPINRGSGAPDDFRLATAAYDQVSACYDREYMLQSSEIDPRIHEQALAQAGTPCAKTTGCMSVLTEPYHPAYFLANGRSMPDDLDPNYAPQYPNQPYNLNPHMHPGEVTLFRIVGQGRWQHPFHEHANHVRVLARDGHLLLNAAGHLSGPMLFTTTTSPGQTIDGLFQYTGKNLNWDIYGHTGSGTTMAGAAAGDDDFNPASDCDANGYYIANTAANNFFEWCGDHKKPLESKPFGNVGTGGPVTLPDPNILAAGAWYGGSVYFGPDATTRAAGPTPIPPFGTVANDPGSEAGFAFMWHSHNEREITTNNVFPGGLMTMMLVDPWVYLIDETK